MSNVVFGTLVVGGSVAAFLAPPFTGPHTLPAMGVVLLSLGVLLEDIVAVLIALIIAAVGIALEIVLGTAATNGLSSLLVAAKRRRLWSPIYAEQAYGV